MRILQVVASYLPATRYGGTIVSVHGLGKALAARGHDVHVFTTSVDGDGDSPVVHDVPVMMDGVTVWYFQSRHLRRLYWAPQLAQALRERAGGFDILHTHAIYLWPMWAAARRARALGLPHVLSPRGMLEKDLIERKSGFWKAALIAFEERRQLEGASAIHVTSGREADEARRFGFDLPPLVEIPNGVEIDDAASPAEVSPRIAGLIEGSPFILFLGRINWKKGLDRLIAALQHAPDVRVLIAGNDEEGYAPKLAVQAQRYGVTDRVTFIGAVAGGDKLALLQSARAMVLPSYSENFGNVIVEAWAAGCPAIVTPEVGLADYVRRHGGGWVVEATPAKIGAQLARVVADRAGAAAAGAIGRQLAETEFTWPAVAQRMEALYQQLLVGRAPAAAAELSA